MVMVPAPPRTRRVRCPLQRLLVALVFVLVVFHVFLLSFHLSIVEEIPQAQQSNRVAALGHTAQKSFRDITQVTRPKKDHSINTTTVKSEDHYIKTTRKELPILIYSIPETCEVRVECMRTNLEGSIRFAMTDNPHQAKTYWTYFVGQRRNKVSLPDLLQETFAERWKRRYPSVAAFDINATDAKSLRSLLLQEDFRLYLIDYGDRSGMSWLHWYIREQLLPVKIPWECIYVITRSVVCDPWRAFHLYAYGPSNTTFQQKHLGGFYNYTLYRGMLYQGVKHFTYPVREDLVHAMEEYMTNHEDGTVSQDAQDSYVGYPRRTKDAISFSPMESPGRWGKFRATISQALHSMKDEFPHVHAGIVGADAKQGRDQTPHVDYVQALLEYKIVVVAQRDGWEDHLRLLEALISGALVLTDPALDFPPGIQDGVHLVVYWSVQDMQDKVRYYLHHDKERQQIALQGRRFALANHRSWQRWEHLLLGNWSKVDAHGLSIMT